MHSSKSFTAFLFPLYLVFLSVGYSHAAVRQPAVTISGSITPFQNLNKNIVKAYLGLYRGKEYKLVDSSAVNTDLTFSLKTPEEPAFGVYEITFSKELGMPLIITRNDRHLRVSVKFKDSTTIEFPEFNAENKAFSAVNRILKEFNSSMNAIAAERKSGNGQNQRTKMESLEKTRDSVMIDFNRKLIAFQQKESGTYAADVISNLIYVQDPGTNIHSASSQHLQFMQEHFFDNIPLQDEKVMYNPFVYDKLVKYMANYSLQKTEGFKKCSDILMGHASANQKVKDFALQFLLDIFIEYGPEDALFYVSDNYMENCTNNIPNVTVNRIKQMRQFKPGALAPEINLPDSSGKTIGFPAEAENHPTMVYFWSSSCAHCQHETPAYVQLYHQFRSKGLVVYAVSLDEKKEDWTTAIREWGLDWINVCDYQKFDSPAAKSYYVFATPSVFLLDRNKKIILANPQIDELAKSLESLYK